MQVELLPLRPDHAAALVGDGAIQRYLPTPILTLHDVQAHISNRLSEPDTIALVVMVDGQVAGTTCFYDVNEKHAHATIGWTYYLQPFRRSGLNSRVKEKMFEMAFLEHGWMRIQFDIDERNERSQRAVKLLGAKHEGTLRQHKILHDGFVRNTTIWSVLRQEWQEQKIRQILRQPQ